jgi:hypothetical protein
MKFRNVFLLILILVFGSSLMQPYSVSAQPHTSAKYVKTAVDTFSVPGLSGVERTGMITNESDSVYLNVYFSNDTGAKLTTSYIRVPPKKTLYFTEKTVKIFRSASRDSCYSQIIIGNTTIGQNLELNECNDSYCGDYVKPGLIYSEAELTGLKFPITLEVKNDTYKEEKAFTEKRYLSSDLTYRRL